MTKEADQQVQRLEHLKRMTQTRLDIIYRQQTELTEKAGTLRCELQRIDNQIYGVVTKRAV